jgi:cation:H+ antiporter
MLTAVFLMGAGLAILTAGGELLVRGASRLAVLAGISPLVVGLTVVAFGTSAPELAVALKASWAGQADITVGNIVGSNIFNVLFVLGLAALIVPLVVHSQLIRFEVPLLIVVSTAMLLLGLDGQYDRLDGAGLFITLLVYVSWAVYQSRRESAAVRREFESQFGVQPAAGLGQIVMQLLLIAAGLVLLGWGARWLVDGAVTVARFLGMSELLIGLTVIAVGTSLPEVAASVVASIRGERDIAVGNAIGSSLFNILCVLGLSAILSPQAITVSETALRLDIPVMIAVAIACLPIFFTGHLIARWEGALFFAYYVAYMAYLVLAAVRPAVGGTFGMIVIGFVVPLTVITLVLTSWRAWREPERPGGSGD